MPTPRNLTLAMIVLALCTVLAFFGRGAPGAGEAKTTEAVSASAPSSGGTLRRSGDQLSFDGPIDARAADAFAAAIAAGGITRVSINSSGGDYDAALRIGQLIKDGRLELLVGVCNSSCADPIFIMAGRKAVQAGGFLSIHGSPFVDADFVVSGEPAKPGADAAGSALALLQARRVRYFQNYVDNGFSINFFLPYYRFLVRQRAFFARAAAMPSIDARRRCPRAQVLWAPPPEYWRAHGLLGVQPFPYPSPEKRGTVPEDLAAVVDPKSPGLFFGSADDLDRLCVAP